MATTNLADIYPLILPGVEGIVSTIDAKPAEYKKIFEVRDSDMYQERVVEMRNPGYASFIEEGQQGALDTLSARYTTFFQHKQIQSSFSFTDLALEDNLYERQWPKNAKFIENSMIGFKNLLAAGIFNNAFNTASPIADGQPLCSAVHPIDGGTYSNVLGGNNVAVDFSEAAVEQALIQIALFQHASGMLANTHAKQFVLPVNLKWIASRLLHSTHRIDTANNDISAIYQDNTFKEESVIFHYLTSPAAFFIQTDADDGFIHFLRTKMETYHWLHDSTRVVTFQGLQRVSFGVANARCVLGSLGM